MNNIFIAGRRTGSNETYVYNYDGDMFTDISNDMFEGTGKIQRLQFLPVQEGEDRDDDSLIEDDRILYITGDINLSGIGSVSSAMYDGSNWYPHLQTFGSDGNKGSLSSVMFSSDFSFTRRGKIKFIPTNSQTQQFHRFTCAWYNNFNFYSIGIGCGIINSINRNIDIIMGSSRRITSNFIRER